MQPESLWQDGPDEGRPGERGGFGAQEMGPETHGDGATPAEQFDIGGREPARRTDHEGDVASRWDKTERFMRRRPVRLSVQECPAERRKGGFERDWWFDDRHKEAATLFAGLGRDAVPAVEAVSRSV